MQMSAVVENVDQALLTLKNVSANVYVGVHTFLVIYCDLLSAI